MPSTNFVKGGLLALTVTLIAMISFEFYVRHEGHKISYDDNEALFADKRAMAYEPNDKATVFIGSSRIKFDLDIPTWEALTGQDVVQLANVGSSPRPVLEDLANDPKFKGNLIVDVTEGLFFSEFALYDGSTRKKIAYFKNRTPTQRFSFQVDRLLESQFVFLDQDNFSINAMLDNTRPPARPGVFPGLYFPWQFGEVTYKRQSYMTPEFVADTNLQNEVKAVWAGFARMPGPPPINGKPLDSLLLSIKVLTDKIKNRGGSVTFVRTPSSGPAFQGEMMGFPRAGYWDKLLAVTGCPGIYFKDYPAIANFVCPEWSHLSPDQAVIYTKNLVKILKEEKGWSFAGKSGAL
jgi:hypothetical protein